MDWVHIYTRKWGSLYHLNMKSVWEEQTHQMYNYFCYYECNTKRGLNTVVLFTCLSYIFWFLLIAACHFMPVFCCENINSRNNFPSTIKLSLWVCHCHHGVHCRWIWTTWYTEWTGFDCELHTLILVNCCFPYQKGRPAFNLSVTCLQFWKAC